MESVSSLMNRMRRIRPLTALIAGNIVLALLVVGVSVTARGGSSLGGAHLIPTPPNTPNLTLTVPLNVAGATSQMAISTNFYQASEVLAATDPAHGSLFQEWNPPMVRLHMGFTGDDIALPESSYGDWDFTKLDAIISRLRATHTSFFLNVRTGPAWMFDRTGQLRDGTYQEFAQFMARLVGWYNKGGFTDEGGHYHASGHQNWVHAWEIWNEPNSGYDIPVSVADPNKTWLDPVNFAQLYSVAANAMRAVDPTIATGGPALSSDPNDTYFSFFLQDVTAPLDFLSFHFYAIGNQQTPDATALAAINDNLLHRLGVVHSLLNARFPNQQIPIWITEVGFNEIARFPVDVRGAAPVGVAFAAASFIAAAENNVALYVQFPFLGNAQLALVDNQTFKPYTPFRLYETLARAFPPGVRLLPATLSQPSGTVALAALAPDGASVRILIANLHVAHPDDVNGVGVPETFRITFAGTAGGASPQAGTTVPAWSFDSTTNPSLPAQSHPVAVFQDNSGTMALQDTLRGYGVEVLDVPLMK